MRKLVRVVRLVTHVGEIKRARPRAKLPILGDTEEDLCRIKEAMACGAHRDDASVSRAPRSGKEGCSRICADQLL